MIQAGVGQLKKRVLVLISLMLLSNNGWSFEIKDAISAIMQKSKTLKSSELALQKAKNQRVIQSSTFRPLLGIESQTQYGGIQNQENYWSNSSSLLLTQNLFNQNLDQLENDKTFLELKLAELGYKREKSSVLLDLFQKYLAVVQNKSIFDFRKSYFLQVEKTRRLIKSQYSGGIRTRQEFLLFEAQFKRTEIEVLAAETNYENALRQLEDLLELRLSDVPVVAVSLGDLKLSQAKSAEIYESEKRKINVKIKSLTAQQAKNEFFYPKLDVSGKLGYSTAGTTVVSTNLLSSSTSGSFWSVQAKLTWTLWDWGAENSKIENAKADLLKQELSEQNEEQLAKTEIQKIEKNISKIKEQKKLTEELLSLQQESYRDIEEKYKSGQQTFYDYSTALSNLLTYQIEKIEIENSLIIESLRLMHRKGFVDESCI